MRCLIPRQTSMIRKMHHLLCQSICVSFRADIHVPTTDACKLQFTEVTVGTKLTKYRKVFTTKESYKFINHLKGHLSKEKYQCPCCFKKFRTVSQCLQHLEEPANCERTQGDKLKPWLYKISGGIISMDLMRANDTLSYKTTQEALYILGPK